MIFINTRPKNRAQLLTDAMQNKGLTVFDLPLLRLETITISLCEQHYNQAFYEGENNYQVLVVVSPTAAHMGLAACPQGFVPDCSVIAVGHKTANILRQAGWQVQCPDEYSNEGMMQMADLSVLEAGDKVLIWRGEGGRRLLIDYLQEKSVVVHSIAWYRRRCPDSALNDFKVIQQKLSNRLRYNIPRHNKSLSKNATFKPIVLISSGEAFSHWRQLFNEAQCSEPEHNESQHNQSELIEATFYDNQLHKKLSDSIQKSAAPMPKNNNKTSGFRLNDFNYLTFGQRLTETLEHLELTCVRVDNLDVDEVWRGVEALTL